MEINLRCKFSFKLEILNVLERILVVNSFVIVKFFYFFNSKYVSI